MSVAAPDAATRVLEMVNANWMTQALGVAAELGLADLLAQEALDTPELARRSGCDVDALGRLLQGLEGLDVVERDDHCRWTLTALGGALRDGAAGSVRHWAIYSARHAWPIWGDLLASVRTGRSARLRATGREGYAHLQEDAASAAVFNRAMVEITRLVAPAVARAADFGAMREVVDVGGGHGELLAAILAAHPQLHGAVVDLAHAADGASRLLCEAGLQARASFVAGSFFEALPAGADAYVLKSIVHNWDDAKATEILRTCRRAAKPGASVLLVERLLPEGRAESVLDRLTLRSDLNMLVGLGGRERTLEHLARLLRAAGFEMRRSVPVGYGFGVVEAR